MAMKTQRAGSRKDHLTELEMIDFLSIAKKDNLRASHDDKVLGVIAAEIRELIAKATESGFFPKQTKAS